ncbi:MAG: RNA recognition motif domain-containing protein [Armatimonadota bacterium]
MALTLYVGNLPWTVTEDELAGAFRRAGRVTAVRIIVDPVTQLSRGYGFVEMEADTVGGVAQAMEATELHGRRLVVGPAFPRRANPGGRLSSGSGTGTGESQ